MSKPLSKRIAVVTGANKGLGFETAKKLCQPDIKLYLCCRNTELGEEAAGKLRSTGTEVVVKELDIADADSIRRFVDDLTSETDHLDILVNNAGIAYKSTDVTPFKDQARNTIHTNYFGTIQLTQFLLPLLRKGDNPRLVFVASESGHLKILKSKELAETFTSKELTIEQLNDLMNQYVTAVETGVHEDKGYPNNNYAMSKLGIIAASKILSRDPANKGILINACCPGYCKTDLTSNKGDKTPEEGARTIAYAALLPKNSTLTGKFFANETEIEW